MKLLGLIFLLIVNANLLAQNYKFEFGTDAGIGYSKFIGKNVFFSSATSNPKDYKFQSIHCFITGVNLLYNIENSFSIKTGCYYEKKGSESICIPLTNVGALSTGVAAYTVNLQCITLPFLIQKSFGNSVKFFMNAGPYFSYTNGKGNSYKKEYASNYNYSKSYGVPNWEVVDFDFGLMTGVGVFKFLKNRFKLSAELRNGTSVTNIYFMPEPNHKARNTATNLMVGFSYSFKEK